LAEAIIVVGIVRRATIEAAESEKLPGFEGQRR
jgi:hypothetical protein